MQSDNKLQEELFQSHIENEKIAASRSMCMLGSLLYLLFAVVDYFAVDTVLEQVLAIRGTVIFILFSFAVLTFTSFLKTLLKQYDLILAILFLIAAAGVEAMIFLSSSGDHASQVYFVGLILVIMSVFGWAYFKVKISMIIVAIILASYSSIEVFKGTSSIALFVNLFFLLSATIISFVSQIIRDRYIRENFILQQALKQKVQEKTVEVKEQEYLANHDQLTGLKNSRYASEKLEEKLQYAKDSDKAMAIMYLDLNGFKQVNDIYGHKAGDEVLKIVAQRLQSCVRHRDCLARIGGDEFVIGLVVKKSELSIVDKLREKIEKMVVKPIGFEGNILQISTSIGMASYPSSGNKINVLMAIADKRMYDAKQKKKMKTLVEEVDETSLKEKDEPVIIFPGT